MPLNRRELLAGLAASPVLGSLSASCMAAAPPDRFDPWIEVEAAALRHNVSVVSKLAGGRPIHAVIKNNAYGLGLDTVAALLEPLPEILGFAVVKAEAAIALRDAGIKKPILLMGLFADADAQDLLQRDIQFSICTDDAAPRLDRAARSAGRKAMAQVYLDTGMSRMGIPWHRVLPALAAIAPLAIECRGTFTALTEDSDFDREQLARLLDVAAAARQQGFDPGPLHAASSHAVFHNADARLDRVRPGIALFGAYPADFGRERSIAALRPALRLKARIVRVERLRAGDSVSYGRNYVAARPTFVATVPAGHTDGVPRTAVDGAEILVNGATYPVIGAVSASHTIIEIGAEPRVAIGDIATLLGPDHPEIHPNRIAEATGTSVYDVLMHLNPALPKVIV